MTNPSFSPNEVRTVVVGICYLLTVNYDLQSQAKR